MTVGDPLLCVSQKLLTEETKSWKAAPPFTLINYRQWPKNARENDEVH